MKIERIQVYEFNHKLREPFIISFKTWHHTENLLVVVETDEKIVGYGEAAPFKPITGDSRSEALMFLQKAIPFLTGSNPSDIESVHKILQDVAKTFGGNSQTAKAALDYACYDILGKAENRPVYQILGCQKPRIVPTTVTVSMKSPKEMAKDVKKLMERFAKNDLKRIKVKISGELDIDVERVLEVAATFDGELTLDANQGYKHPKEAVKLLNRLYNELGSRILLIEEPCPKGYLDALRYVTENSPIPVYADESMATLEDMIQVVEKKAATGVNIKLPKAGGLFWGRKIADLAERNGFSVMVGPMIEGAIGIAAGSHFAAGTRIVSNVDLDTDLYFETSIITEATRPAFRFGSRVPSNRPGLGVKLKTWVKEVLDGEIELRRKG